MSQVLSTFYKEGVDGPRAEVVRKNGAYAIEFYDVAGNLLKEENFAGKSLQYVEDAAENWTFGIKHLNG